MPVGPTSTRRLGATDVEVTVLGFGGATIGGISGVVAEAQARATLAAAFDAGIGLFDTAPSYGNGQSEHRIGAHFRECVDSGGRKRAELVLATKVGKLLRRPRPREELNATEWPGGLPFRIRWDFSYDGVMRAYEDSLQRLGVTRVDLLTIHDLDYSEHATPELSDRYLDQLVREGGWRALEELKAAAEIRAVGAGINDPGTITRFAERISLDYVLLAMPYSLVEQALLEDELSYCVEHDIGIIKGAPYASGILATGAVPGATYNYSAPAPEVHDKVARIAAVCDRHGVPLRAAALQFALAHPAIATVIPGAVTPAEVRDNAAMLAWSIPEDLWRELKQAGLLRADAPTPETDSSVQEEQ
jgi:D-threo-aldose 1-dehydrogenase